MRSLLFTEALKRDLGGYQAIEVFRRYARQAPTDHPLSLVQYLDMKTYLPGDILTKSRPCQHGSCVGGEGSILDHQFVDWISQLPPGLKLKDGKVNIYSKSTGTLSPNEILYRPKMDFPYHWQAGSEGP